jgi:hypothetical protein
LIFRRLKIIYSDVFRLIQKGRILALLNRQKSPTLYYRPAHNKEIRLQLFSNTFNVCSFLRVRDQVSHPFKEVNLWYISIISFLDKKFSISAETKSFHTECRLELRLKITGLYRKVRPWCGNKMRFTKLKHLYRLLSMFDPRICTNMGKVRVAYVFTDLSLCTLACC